MVYKKSIKWLHLEYLKEHPTIDCSLSTFVKYRPFYIEVPIEREAILLVHCMLKCTYKIIRINTFRKLEKLQPIYFVIEYLESQEDDDADHALYLNGVQRKT